MDTNNTGEDEWRLSPSPRARDLIARGTENAHALVNV